MDRELSIAIIAISVFVIFITLILFLKYLLKERKIIIDNPNIIEKFVIQFDNEVVNITMENLNGHQIEKNTTWDLHLAVNRIDEQFISIQPKILNLMAKIRYYHMQNPEHEPYFDKEYNKSQNTKTLYSYHIAIPMNILFAVKNHSHKLKSFINKTTTIDSAVLIAKIKYLVNSLEYLNGINFSKLEQKEEYGKMTELIEKTKTDITNELINLCKDANISIEQAKRIRNVLPTGSLTMDGMSDIMAVKSK